MLNKLRYNFANTCRKIGIGFDGRNDKNVKNMLKVFSKLENKKIKFKIEFDENGNWSAESINLPGIITGGNVANNDLHELILDAIFTYFDIAPEYSDISIFTTKHRSHRTKTENIVYNLATA